MKLAFVSSHPAPYRDSFLGLLVRGSSFETEVYSLSPNDAGHNFWKLDAPPYENRVLVAYEGMSWSRVFFKLLRNIVFGRYECVCWPGFTPPYLILCMLIQALMGKRYIIAADTVQQRKINGIGFHLKRFLVRRAAFLFVPGKKSCDFFANTFNVSRDKICLGVYSLDGKQLERRIGELREERAKLRTEYGIGINDKVFLMVANMIKTRHYPVTAEAFLRAMHGRNDVKFVMVGRGPELAMMQKLEAKESSLKVLPGVPFGEMLKLYALSDVYVHGGTEPASTALVIGAIAHLPLISSPAVGCFADVVKDGESGYAVEDYLSVDQWVRVFKRAVGEETDWKRMGDSARRFSEKIDSDVVVKEFCQMVSSQIGSDVNV